MLLVEFNHNWADEFDVHGLAIMTQEQYKQNMKYAERANYYFGTNEGWEDEDLTHGFKVLSSDPKEIEVIERVLNFSTYTAFKTWGNFPCLMESAYDEIYNQYEVTLNYEIYFKGELIGVGTEEDYFELIHTDIEKRFPEFRS